MAKLDRTGLEGFVPAIVTPFDERGAILTDAFEAMVERLISIGASGICVAGDNGESWALDLAERVALTRLAVKVARGRVPVITGTSAPSAARVTEYARAAEDAGAAAILLMPQTYVLKATREELLRRFEAVGKASGLPIVLYNSPRRAGIELSVTDIEAILSVAPVIGIKESSRDFFHHTHLIHRLKERIAIMVGPSHFIMPGIALGAHGFVATSPELLGARAGGICDLARAAPSAEAARTHYELSVLYQTLMSTGTWPSALKAALNLLGLNAGVPREPVLPLAGDDLEKLRQTMASLGLPVSPAR